MKKALLIIVIFAVVLRLVKFGQIATFGFDSSRDLILTYKMLNYGEIIYRGPVFSVIWGFVSPIYYYLLFPFHVLFNFNPNTSSFVGAIFGLLTVVIAFYAAKK
jgi:predicted membrane-bound mannosyltransferase